MSTPMQAIEMVEDRVLCVTTVKGDMPMIIGEEQIDISFMECPEAEVIAKSLASTEVGSQRTLYPPPEDMHDG